MQLGIKVNNFQSGGYGYPPNSGHYPPQNTGYPPQNPGYPPQNPGYPPQSNAYPTSSSSQNSGIGFSSLFSSELFYGFSNFIELNLTCIFI